MRHKLMMILTLISFSVTSSPLSAQGCLTENKARSDKLDWELSDQSMKKTATSMVMWGILIPIVITVLSLAINPSNSDTTTSTSS